MTFKKFQHVERWGNSEVEGIEKGLCFIFPKLDGTNGSVWIEGGDAPGTLRCGSRNQELVEGKDNHGFRESVESNEQLKAFFFSHRWNYRLFGEWLVPNKLRTYEPDAWRKFYIFDVVEETNEEFKYLEFDYYEPLLKEFKLDYIQPMAEIENPTTEELTALLDENTYLIQHGKGCGEGLVIKNYQFVNRYGRTTWAKLVREEFEQKAREKKPKLQYSVEGEAVEKFLTPEMIEKTYYEIRLVHGDGLWTSSMIPRFLETVYHDFVVEEIWSILKKMKYPKIDFKVLRSEVIEKVKEVKNDLF